MLTAVRPRPSSRRCIYTLASRIRSLATTSTINERSALPLSDAQRKTIYALSTPPGKSGVAVVRVSGPDALSVWQRMIRSTRSTTANTNQDTSKRTRKRERTLNEKTSQLQHYQRRLPEPWKLERCHVVDPQTSEHLDHALSVFFRCAPLPLPFSPFPLLLTRQKRTNTPICSCATHIRTHSPALIHYRRRARTPRARRACRHQRRAIRARTRTRVPSRPTGRVHAPRVRGWPARPHAGRRAARPRGRRDRIPAARGAARCRGGCATFSFLLLSLPPPL